MATEVTQLVDEYKNLANKAVENAKNYVNNLPQKIEDAKNACQNLVPTLTDYANSLSGDMRTLAQDTSPPGEEAGLYKNLLENYMWVGVCLLASSIISIALGKIASVFLGIVLTAGAATMIALVAIPYLMVNYIPTMEGSDDDRRMALLVVGVVGALVMAPVYAGSHMEFYAPPVWLLACGMAVMSRFVGTSVGGRARHVFLGAAIGAPFGFFFVYGMMMGSLGGMYFLWLIGLGAAAVIDMQVKIGRFKGGQTATPLHQGISLAVFFSTAVALTFISSTRDEDAEN